VKKEAGPGKNRIDGGESWSRAKRQFYGGMAARAENSGKSEGEKHMNISWQIRTHVSVPYLETIAVFH
jgi:hypothetical protein